MNTNLDDARQRLLDEGNKLSLFLEDKIKLKKWARRRKAALLFFTIKEGR